MGFNSPVLEKYTHSNGHKIMEHVRYFSSYRTWTYNRKRGEGLSEFSYAGHINLLSVARINFPKYHRKLMTYIQWMSLVCDIVIQIELLELNLDTITPRTTFLNKRNISEMKEKCLHITNQYGRVEALF